MQVAGIRDNSFALQYIKYRKVCCFMKKMFLSIGTFLLCLFIFFVPSLSLFAEEDSMELTSPSALLMDAATGTVIYEKEPHEQRPLASVTKIMTMLLIFEALEDGRISLEDDVTVSEHAASMGGSQVFLEANEVQTVDTMLKCISIASANDACVAMAEYISGTEEDFVAKMNEKATALGMNDTHFVNCCGLDADGHVSSAWDIALMSRELITRFPQIHNYSTIWQEDITHVTAKGEKPFTLTNTNKLIKQYEYATGLKTGSTSQAKYCLSATAKKDGLNLIAVIMAAPDYKVRFSEAKALLNYGFSVCSIYEDSNTDVLSPIPVTGGKESEVSIAYESPFQYLLIDKTGAEISKEINLPEELSAPVKENDVVGTAVYKIGDTEIGSVNIISTMSVDVLTLKDNIHDMFSRFFLAGHMCTF